MNSRFNAHRLDFNKIVGLRLPAVVQGAVPAVLCLLVGLSDRLYIDTDTFWISIVCKGLYGPNSYNLFLHPLLCRIVAGMNTLIPNADCFALLSHILIVLAVWWLGTVIAMAVTDPVRRLLFYGGFILCLYRHSLFNKNFTVHSALFVAVALGTLLVLLRRPEESPHRHLLAVMAAVFLSLGFLWRDDCALLALPFLVLDIAALLLTKRIRFSTVCKRLFPCLLCTVFLLGYKSWFYARAPYAENLDYNNARKTLTDFPIKPWDEVADVLAPSGLTENDYNGFDLWLYNDPEILTKEKLTLAVEAGAVPAYPLSAAALSGMTADIYDIVLDSQMLQMLLWVAALCLFGLLAAASAAGRIEGLLACVGGGLILLYFSYKGRVRDRVCIAVLFCVLAVLLPLLNGLPHRTSVLFRRVRGVVACVLAGLCLVTAVTFHYQLFQSALSACAAADTTEPALPGEGPDTIYIWNALCMNMYLTPCCIDTGHLPDADFIQRNLPYGDWTSGQDYFLRSTAALENSNLMKALATRPNTYLVALRPNPVQAFLQEHYGADLMLEPIGSQEIFALGEVTVWQVVHTAE